MSATSPANGVDLDVVEALAKAATQGEWRREAMGGSSTVILSQKPSRNDSRIPAYGFDDARGHCLAYPFIEDDGRIRWDFVCFSHGDAAFIAAASPAVVLELIALARRTASAEAEGWRLREGLGLAEQTFRNYAQLHSAKGTPEGDRKAQANTNAADMCARALTGASDHGK